MPCRPTRCSIRGSKCEKSWLEADRSWTIAICWRDPFRDGAAPAWRIAILFPFRSISCRHLGVGRNFLGSALALLSGLENGGNADQRFQELSDRYLIWWSQNGRTAHIQKLTNLKNILDGNRQPLILLPFGTRATWWRRSCCLSSHDLRQNAGTGCCVMWEKLQWRSTDILLWCLNRAPGLILSRPRRPRVWSSICEALQQNGIEVFGAGATFVDRASKDTRTVSSHRGHVGCCRSGACSQCAVHVGSDGRRHHWTWEPIVKARRCRFYYVS